MTQSEYYLKMMTYKFEDAMELPVKVSADYYKIAEIEGIEFYTPNDEDWGAIVAISHEHKLAHCTGFYEMDDMAGGEDYKQVVQNGLIICAFEMETETPDKTNFKTCVEAHFHQELEIAHRKVGELYKIISGKKHHDSDCATNNAPAELPEPCNCTRQQPL